MAATAAASGCQRRMRSTACGVFAVALNNRSVLTWRPPRRTQQRTGKHSECAANKAFQAQFPIIGQWTRIDLQNESCVMWVDILATAAASRNSSQECWTNPKFTNPAPLRTQAKRLACDTFTPCGGPGPSAGGPGHGFGVLGVDVFSSEVQGLLVREGVWGFGFGVLVGEREEWGSSGWRALGVGFRV